MESFTFLTIILMLKCTCNAWVSNVDMEVCEKDIIHIPTCFVQTNCPFAWRAGVKFSDQTLG
jgi:hypothetical protein